MSELGNYLIHCLKDWIRQGWVKKRQSGIYLMPSRFEPTTFEIAHFRVVCKQRRLCYTNFQFNSKWPAAAQVNSVKTGKRIRSKFGFGFGFGIGFRIGFRIGIGFGIRIRLKKECKNVKLSKLKLKG